MGANVQDVYLTEVEFWACRVKGQKFESWNLVKKIITVVNTSAARYEISFYVGCETMSLSAPDFRTVPKTTKCARNNLTLLVRYTT